VFAKYPINKGLKEGIKKDNYQCLLSFSPCPKGRGIKYKHSLALAKTYILVRNLHTLASCERIFNWRPAIFSFDLAKRDQQEIIT